MAVYNKDLDRLQHELQSKLDSLNSKNKSDKTNNSYIPGNSLSLVTDKKESTISFDEWIQQQLALIHQPICLILDGSKTQIKMYIKG